MLPQCAALRREVIALKVEQGLIPPDSSGDEADRDTTMADAARTAPRSAASGSYAQPSPGVIKPPHSAWGQLHPDSDAEMDESEDDFTEAVWAA